MSDLRKTFNKYLIKLKNGEKVFEEFYNNTSAFVEHIAYKYLSNKLNVDDVISETYIRVLENIDSFDPDQNGYSWMYTIAKNFALNFNADESRQDKFRRQQTVAEVAAVDDAQLDKYDVERALLMLDERERQLAEKSVFEDKSYKQISNELDMPVSTVHRLCKKAINKLIKLLEDFKK